MKVQKVEELHFGTISVALALKETRYLIALIIKTTGGTSRLFSSRKFWQKQSTLSDPGFQNKELNLFNFLLCELPKRSIV